MSSNNPYMSVQGPNYGAGLMDWSQLGQMGQANKPGAPNQSQAGALGPNITQPVVNGQAVMPGQGTQQQQQMQGLGQRLMALFGGGSGGGQPNTGQPMSLAPPTAPPQPSGPPPNPASPYGLY